MTDIQAEAEDMTVLLKQLLNRTERSQNCIM